MLNFFVPVNVVMFKWKVKRLNIRTLLSAFRALNARPNEPHQQIYTSKVHVFRINTVWQKNIVILKCICLSHTRPYQGILHLIKNITQKSIFYCPHKGFSLQFGQVGYYSLNFSDFLSPCWLSVEIILLVSSFLHMAVASCCMNLRHISEFPFPGWIYVKVDGFWPRQKSKTLSKKKSKPSTSLELFHTVCKVTICLSLLQ